MDIYLSMYHYYSPMILTVHSTVLILLSVLWSFTHNVDVNIAVNSSIDTITDFHPECANQKSFCSYICPRQTVYLLS
jgi:glutamine amidotransferase PdxT